MALILSTDALINTHYLGHSTSQLITYKRIEGNKFSFVRFNTGSSTPHVGHEVNPQGDRSFLFPIVAPPGFLTPFISKLNHTQPQINLLSRAWLKISYPDSLFWVRLVNGHVGDYSTIMFNSKELINTIKDSCSKDSQIDLFDILTKEKKTIFVSELGKYTRKPYVYFILGTFGNEPDRPILVVPGPDSVSVYNKFGKEINIFLTKFFDAGVKVFNSEAAVSNPNLTQYWSKLNEILSPATATELEESLLQVAHPPQAAEPLQLPKFAPELDNLTTIFKNLKENEHTQNQLTITINSLNDQIERVTNLISTYKENLINSKKDLSNVEATKTKSFEKITSLKEEIKAQQANIPPIEFTTNKLFDNYEIGKINLRFDDGKFLRYPTREPTLHNFFEKLYDGLKNGLAIYSLELFLTTKNPSIIYVDKAEKGEKGTAVLGGPYRIIVTFANNDLVGTIAPKSINSIVGLSPVNLTVSNMKAHPHSASTAFDKDNSHSIGFAFSLNTNICWGEAKANIIKAIRKGNLSLLLAVIDSWITSANSRDRWGAEYNWFPLYDKDK